MEQDVPVKVAHNTLTTPAAGRILYPKQTCDNVYAPRVLLPRDESIAAVSIANLTNESILIPAGTELEAAELAHTNSSNEASTSPGSASKARPGFEHVQSVIDSFPEELSAVEQLEATKLLPIYQDIFSKSEYNLGRTLMTEHRIDTRDDCSIKQGLRR